VAIASRNLEKLGAAAEEMSKFGDCHPIQCNIREEEDAKQVYIGHRTGLVLSHRRFIFAHF
jgi:hypothetical protein